MKCEHCGKNEVSFVYQSSVNGRVREARLCGRCAEELGYSQAVAARSRRMMQGFFGGGSLLDGFFGSAPRRLGGASPFEDLFDDFFAEMPALGAVPAPAQTQPEEPEQAPLVEEPERSRFSRMRRLNALRLEQKAAVLREDFEKAAQIRDQIRELEQAKAAKPQQPEQ